MVIEMYVASYDISCMPDVVEPASRMAAFRLNNPVDTFRNGIVGGFVVFRHTDGNAMFLKKCHVWVATVLYATVRVYPSGSGLSFCTRLHHTTDGYSQRATGL